jgi:hypothetical protein
MKKPHSKVALQKPSGSVLFLGALVVLGFVVVVVVPHVFATTYTKASLTATSKDPVKKDLFAPAVPKLDTIAYDKKVLANANLSSTTLAKLASTTANHATSTLLWPAKAPYPKVGALLPYNRIIAYYGNFYSTKMGVLGEYEPSVMKQKLFAEKAKWEAADPTTPVIPAIDYIAITAQGSPGADGKYRFRMPASEIDKAVKLADEVHGIVILDIQVGLSNLQTELPLLDEYLKKPNVHLAIDPEFSMKGGEKPGTVIGTFSSADVNFAAQHLAKLVQDNNLPPKVLIIHRFTQNMVTGVANIKPLPEVQMVMDMDGWGDPAKKLNTYQRFVYGEPVQFTGFKLFYKNDIKAPSTRMLTPSELLKLLPQPLFIQFQ